MVKQSVIIFDNESEKIFKSRIANAILEETGLINRIKEDPDRFLLLYDDGEIKISNEVRTNDVRINDVRGLGYFFRLYGLIRIFNDYFVNNKIEIKARKLIMNDIIYIKFEKFMRLDLISRSKEKDDIGRDIIGEIEKDESEKWRKNK